MEVAAFINGVEQRDTISVRMPHVAIIPSKDSMKFSIETHNDAGNVTRKELQSQTISVAVSAADGTPLSSKVVTLSFLAQSGTAGHLHVGGKPWGTSDSVQVKTGSTGTASFTFTAPKVSGPVVISGTLPYAAKGTATIAVGVFDLEELPPGPDYDLIGDIPNEHVQNHFARPAHLQALQAFAAWFYAKFGQKPTFNDTSLPLGGTYDVNLDWDQPHIAHSEGRGTDLRTTDMDPRWLPLVKRHWEQVQKGIVGDETKKKNGEPAAKPHYHLMIG